MTWLAEAGLYGLHVDLGHQSTRGYWIRKPTVDFTCRHGWSYGTAGVDEVTRFCRNLDAFHAKYCPGATPPTGGEPDASHPDPA